MKTYEKLSKFFLFALILSVILALLISPHIFFQQDEYYLFFNCNSWGFPWTKVLGTHFTPFRDWLYCLQYKSFNLAVYPRIVITLFLHFSILGMIYLLLRKLGIYLQKISILLILLFIGTNVIVSQTYLWLSTYSGSVTSILMSLISIYFFIDFLRESKKSSLYLCYLFLLIGLLFKEYVLYLFPLYFLLYIFNIKGNKINFFMVTFIPLTFIYLIFRMYLQLHGSPSDTQLITNEANLNHVFASLQSYTIFWIISPIQILIPSNLFYDLTKLSNNSLQNQVLLHNLQILSGTILWTLIGIFTFKRFKKDERFRSIIVFGLVMYSCSLIPFTIIVNSIGQFYLESRYYYVISIAFCLVLSAIFAQYRHEQLMTYIMSILIILCIINLNYYYINLINLKKTADVRKQIIANITIDIASKQSRDNLLVYISGNSPGYYGLPSVKIPFQTGFGNVLAIHLYDKHVFIDNQYFKNSSALNLYNLSSQGVYKFGYKTYGYFQNYNTLRSFIEKNPTMVAYIKAFYWDSRQQKLLDMSNQVITLLKNS